MNKYKTFLIALIIIFIGAFAMAFVACSGTDGADGTNGTNGTDGKDGTTLTSVTPDYDADGETVLSYTLVFSDGTTFTITNGKSAYQLYKEAYGYTGTEAEWLYDLVNGNLSYKAEYTVTFDYNDGETESYSVTVTEGNKVASPEDPVRDGYTFDGWYCGDEKWSFIGYVVTGDITLTAQWTEEEKVTDGLQYTISSDYLYYTVTGYTGTDTKVYIPETYNGLTVMQIGENAFYGNENITYVEFADTISVIGDYAFYECTALDNIELPSDLTTIGNNAFYYCSALTSITIPDGVTEIGVDAFWCCTSLESVNISENSKLTSIPNFAFADCSALTSIYIPDNVTEIGDSAFIRCLSLESVNISGNSELTLISDYAFGDCIALTSITIPDGVTKIGVDAFCNCTSLETVTIGRNSSLATIDGSAFFACTSLTGITIPSTVTFIGISAFDGCTALTSVYYAGTEWQWSLITIGGSNEYLTAAEITYNYEW